MFATFNVHMAYNRTETVMRRGAEVRVNVDLISMVEPDDSIAGQAMTTLTLFRPMGVDGWVHLTVEGTVAEVMEKIAEARNE